jgi:hypothetical protein
MASKWTVVGFVALQAACGVQEGATGEAFDPEGISGTTAGEVGGSVTGESPPASSGPTSVGTTTSGSSQGGTSLDPTDSDGGTETGESDEGSTGVHTDCRRVQVNVGAGLTLNVRPDPSTANAPVGSLSHGAIVDVLGESTGESIDGVDLWFEIQNPATQGYVLSSLVTCTTKEPPELDGFYLPLPCGTTAQVTQGNNGALSHNGLSAFAFDFGLPLGSSLVAIADGVVTHAFGGTGPGDPCYNGGGMECSGFANYVTLLHADGTKSVYMHLQMLSVGVGDSVSIGAQVGLSGSTGWSTGRHAHIMRMEDCGGSYCQSVPLAFSDVAGDGVPVSGDTVTSGNCP